MADYYQLLGVTPRASAGEIRHAYAQLAREKHPDRFPDPAAKQQAQRAFQDITTAFNTLANPKSRQEYDATRDKPVPRTPEEIATDAYERSQAALEAGDLDEAVNLLRTAVHHAPTQVAYQLALGRALGKAAGAQAAEFSPEERELLVRLGGLFVKVNRSFGALRDRLTGEQREEIAAMLERARTALREGVLSVLRECVEEMQRASRLLEEWSKASPHSS